MSWRDGVWSRLRGFFLRRREEREMDEELAFHLEMQVEENVTAGMSPKEARRRAILEFGGVERYREAVRDERRVPVVDDLWRDFRQAWRTLLRTPGYYSAVIVLTLSLAMGTSVAIATIVRGLITDPIPVPEADRLFAFGRTTSRSFSSNPTYEDFRVWESEVERLVELGGSTYGSLTIGDGSTTSYARGFRVTEGFFPALSLRPRLGRVLLPSDHEPSSEPVVVLSHRVWERVLDGDPEAVGRTVLLDGRPHTVAGVLETGAEFPAPVDLWYPLQPAGDEAAGLYLDVIGRLRPGVVAEEVGAALTAIQQGLEADRSTDERTTGAYIGPWTGRFTDEAIQATRMLHIAVLLLLLIGAANSSGLMLTKGITRSREFAIRASLGATRWRLGRQLLAESVILATLAGLLGLLVAYVTIRLVRLGPAETFAHNNMLGWERLGLDGRSLTYALVLSALVGIVFGMTPALKATGRDLVTGLRDGTPASTTDRGRSRILRFLLCGEVAFALVLLTTGGLLARSVFEIVRLDPGHAEEGVLTVRWTLPADSALPDDRTVTFQSLLLDRLGAMPGVETVAVTSNLPATRFGRWSRQYQVADSGSAAGTGRASWRSITPGYLGSMGITLVVGRDIDGTDREGSPPIALVSETLARRHWPNLIESIGRRITLEEEGWTIVGVVRDVLGPNRDPAPAVYIPQSQSPISTGFVVARIGGNPVSLAAQLRAEIWRIDPAIAVGEVETIERILRDTWANERTLALLVGVFAVLALVITVISLYALIAHSVARRKQEIGIRLALGALPRQILQAAMWDGLFAVVVGTTIGAVLGFGASRLMAGMVYGFNPNDSLVLMLATAGLLLVVVLTSYLPARNAARTDPLISLRAE
ncbi:MAG: FtsX-like permease family protein [Gemmatimonas sp.]|nr:FtsX-like permease family protein [Gemmatimonas sp.]